MDRQRRVRGRGGSKRNEYEAPGEYAHDIMNATAFIIYDYTKESDCARAARPHVDGHDLGAAPAQSA